jgi:adenine-specific DNA-methyltransferase
MSPEAVPGASVEERTALAAMGGVAATLARDRSATWPEPVRDWLHRGPTVPPNLVKGLEHELANGSDVLARVYEAIVSGRNRRRLGTFFTPRPVVEFMLDAAEHLLSDPKVVIDPGAGVGAFSLAAKRRWPLAHVLAVDINVVTLGLLGAQSDGAIDLVLADYLSWARGPNLPGGQSRLWVGNPPYTRHQDLSMPLKKSAASAAGELVTSGLAGLSAYFLAATVRSMAPADILCFLLPGSWTEARYGKPLRVALRDLGSRSIDFVGFASDLDVFPGTRVTAMILVLGPDRSGPPRPMRTATARLTLSGVSASKPTERSRLDGAINDLGGWLWPRRRSSLADGRQLGDVTTVRRGVATGANEYFLLTRANRDRLPAAATVRAVRRLRHVPSDALTLAAHDRLASQGERCWLLQIDNPELLTDPAVDAWLDAAKNAGVTERYLVKHRDPWYRVEHVDPPDLFVSPMGKRHMRVVTNEASAIPSNALYGVYLKDPGAARAIATWLNGEDGQVALLERARTYGADLFKLEPRDLLTIRLPRGVLGEASIDMPRLDRSVVDHRLAAIRGSASRADIASSAGSSQE